jgi:hypothetical protein
MVSAIQYEEPAACQVNRRQIECEYDFFQFQVLPNQLELHRMAALPIRVLREQPQLLFPVRECATSGGWIVVSTPRTVYGNPNGPDEASTLRHTITRRTSGATLISPSS